MDQGQTFLWVHARLFGMLSQLLTPRIRLVLEYAYLAIMVVLFFLLVVMHTNFVQQPASSSKCTQFIVNVSQFYTLNESISPRCDVCSKGYWKRIQSERLVGFRPQESVEFCTTSSS